MNKRGVLQKNAFDHLAIKTYRKDKFSGRSSTLSYTYSSFFKLVSHGKDFIQEQWLSF